MTNLSSLRKKEERVNLLIQKFKHEHYHQLHRNKKDYKKMMSNYTLTGEPK